MDSNKLLSLLKKTDTIEQSDLASLESIRKKHPYFQASHILLAQANQVLNTPKTNSTYNKALAYTTNEQYLNSWLKSIPEVKQKESTATLSVSEITDNKQEGKRTPEVEKKKATTKKNIPPLSVNKRIPNTKLYEEVSENVKRLRFNKIKAVKALFDEQTSNKIFKEVEGLAADTQDYKPVNIQIDKVDLSKSKSSKKRVKTSPLNTVSKQNTLKEETKTEKVIVPKVEQTTTGKNESIESKKENKKTPLINRGNKASEETVKVKGLVLSKINKTNLAEEKQQLTRPIGTDSKKVEPVKENIKPKREEKNEATSSSASEGLSKKELFMKSIKDKLEQKKSGAVLINDDKKTAPTKEDKETKPTKTEDSEEQLPTPVSKKQDTPAEVIEDKEEPKEKITKEEFFKSKYTAEEILAQKKERSVKNISPKGLGEVKKEEDKDSISKVDTNKVTISDFTSDEQSIEKVEENIVPQKEKQKADPKSSKVTVSKITDSPEIKEDIITEKKDPVVKNISPKALGKLEKENKTKDTDSVSKIDTEKIDVSRYLVDKEALITEKRVSSPSVKKEKADTKFSKVTLSKITGTPAIKQSNPQTKKSTTTKKATKNKLVKTPTTKKAPRTTKKNKETLISGYIESLKEDESSSKGKKTSTDIVDEFIKKEKNLKPIKPVKTTENTSTVDLSQASSTEQKPLISENLAKIYAKQGNTEKATKIYQELILKYPAKKTYFTDRIKELEKK
ncbi:MAG: hypothetical protein AB8B61_07070 [Cyclobacteriaceae bacterium]